jgi:hypothetical protein
MNTLKRLMLLGWVGFWLLAGCATSPEPFDYQQNNEMKPGPGIFTGEEGVYTIYGSPPKPAKETPGTSQEEGPAEPDDPAVQ